MTSKHNDPRADHVVHVFDDATNVKFYHKGYEISLAADGLETIVFGKDGSKVSEFAGTSAVAVADAVKFIEILTSK